MTQALFMQMVCADDEHDLKLVIDTPEYKKYICKECGAIIEDFFGENQPKE